jgi:hypothetical protein
MTYPEFKIQVARTRENNPVWFALESDPPATEAEITSAEAALQVAFPEEYRRFVSDFGGAYFAFVNVFSVHTGSDWNIVERNNRDALGGFIKVSDNGVGDFFGFCVADGKCRPEIWFRDHEERGHLKPTKHADLFEFLVAKALKC